MSDISYDAGDPSKVDPAAGDPEPQPAVTGRPNDIPIDEAAPAPLGGNSTFADRARAQRGEKRVADGENKAVSSAATKSRKARKG